MSLRMVRSVTAVSFFSSLLLARSWARRYAMTLFWRALSWSWARTFSVSQSRPRSSSINPNVFAVYHWRRLQIQHSVDNFGDPNQARNGMELFQHLMVVVGVHRSVNHA